MEEGGNGRENAEKGKEREGARKGRTGKGGKEREQESKEVRER